MDLGPLPEKLQPVVAFHGHLCPGLLIGYRAALAASQALNLGKSEDEELVTIAENNSCSVDAFQQMLSTTFGKGNLIWRDYGKQAFTVIDRRQNRAVRVSFIGDKLKHTLPDGKVDRGGRFWAGTMDPRSATSALYRLDPDHTYTRMAEGITISNGLGWDPNNHRMYYVDTLAYVVYAYNFNARKGSLSGRRVFLQVPPEEGLPDGLTVDNQGYIWIAFYDGWRVTRYAPDGKVDRHIDLPVARPTCPAFGGKALDELYITTAIDGLSNKELAKQPQAGNLFMLKPGVQGLPEPEFLG